MRATRSSFTHSTRALLLTRVAYGESDLIVNLFTESTGRLAALARGARRSSKRFSGALEPMHTLQIGVNERPQGELFVLREAALDVPRTRLTSDLDSLEAAGKGLSWLRRSAPPRTPEPAAWEAITHFLDRLDEESGRQNERLVELGMRLLDAFGWGLDLTRCVRCGKPCPEHLSSLVSAERGGLVCRACGGGPLRLSAALRRGLTLATLGHDDALPAGELSQALTLVERALTAHMGFE